MTVSAFESVYSGLHVRTLLIWETLFSKTRMQTDLGIPYYSRHVCLLQRPCTFWATQTQGVLQPYHKSRTFTQEEAAGSSCPELF